MKSAPRVRRRLTAWYGLSAMVLLFAALLAVRQFTRQTLRNEHNAATTRSAELVRAFFRAELTEYRQVDVTVAHLASELVFAGIGIDFLKPDGTLFASARRPLREAEPLPPVAVLALPLEEQLAPNWMLRLRISTASLATAQARIDRLTLLAVPLVAALAAFVAWLTTGRALAPVRTMAAAADKLQAAGTGRLPVADPTDEFGRLGNAFNRLLERLDAALAQQRRFLADAAHELRTPIARMRSESEARLAAPPGADDRLALERVRDELGHTSQLIDELLYVARSDADALPVQAAPLFLDDVVSDVVARFGTEARARGVTFDLTALREARIAGDATLLQRLVGVLVDNAVRYSPEGGTIAVSVGPDAGRVLLRVDDAGPGIPPDEREMVFHRFYRGQAARAIAPEGTGLGLAIAADAAARHGAHITMGESPLGGAALLVSFPAA